MLRDPYLASNNYQHYYLNRHIIFDRHQSNIYKVKFRQVLMMMMMMMNCFDELTNERRLTLFPAGTIVRDPHHRQPLTRREQDLNLRGT